METWGWLLLGAGFILASLPFIHDCWFLGIPIFRVPKTVHWRVFEFVLAYALFILLGRLIEGYLGQNMIQGWAFYVVVFLLFVVAAFPAFMWRYLWSK